MLGHVRSFPGEERSDSLFAGKLWPALLTGGFLCASLIAGWVSTGVYHEDDLTHYLFARWAHHDVRFLADCWGRPGFTVPYSWPAAWGSSANGFAACRAFSALLSAATAWLAYCVGSRMGLRLAWGVIPLLFLQPLFAKLSLTTLTETPLAFYLALATWLLMRGRTEWSAAIIALGPITRDEAVIILPLWAVAMWLRGAKWWSYPLLLWAVAVHNLFAFLAMDWWPVLRWLKPQGADHYGQGTPLTFVPKMVFASGPVVVALAILGAKRAWKRPLGWLMVLGCVGWFGLQTVLYMRGAYSSGGYARFLVPISPWLAILACAGAEPLFFRRVAGRAATALALTVAMLLVLCQVEWQWQPPVKQPEWQFWVMLGRIGLAALVVGLVVCAARIAREGLKPAPAHSRFVGVTMGLLLLSGLGGLLPLRLTADQKSLQSCSETVSRLLGEDRRVITLNLWFYHWGDRWVSWANSYDLRKQLSRAGPGTIFVWDKRFCTDPTTKFQYAEMRAQSDWQLLWTTPESHLDVPLAACFERQHVMQAANPEPPWPTERND